MNITIRALRHALSKFKHVSSGSAVKAATGRTSLAVIKGAFDAAAGDDIEVKVVSAAGNTNSILEEVVVHAVLANCQISGITNSTVRIGAGNTSVIDASCT